LKGLGRCRVGFGYGDGIGLEVDAIRHLWLGECVEAVTNDLAECEAGIARNLALELEVQQRGVNLGSNPDHFPALAFVCGMFSQLVLPEPSMDQCALVRKCTS
jgi:hypothetical protein